MHQLLSGTLRHITAVNFAPRQYIVRHTTLCMRFSSSTSPFLMPHCAEVTAHAALFHTLNNIILGFCTHIRRTLLVISLLHSSPITLAPTTKQHQAINILPYPTLQSRHPWAPRVGSSYTGCAFALRRATILLIRWCHNTLYARILYI